MKYTILSVKQKEDFIFTEVQYDYADGTTVVVVIPHFQPKTFADVELGIKNRAASEGQKLEAVEVGTTLKNEIDAVVGVAVEFGEK